MTSKEIEAIQDELRYLISQHKEMIGTLQARVDRLDDHRADAMADEERADFGGAR